MSAGAQLVAAIRRGLAEHADPERAPHVQAYLKSETPCLGVTVPLQRQIVRQVAKEHPLENFEEWRDTVLELWRGPDGRGPEYRELLLCAVHLTGQPQYRAFRTLGALPLYEELIVTGAWWDLVDDVATHRLSALLLEHPAEMCPEMLAWSRDESMWKRRSSIICQVGLKEKADLELLFACIEPNLADREFFIRKAIGWALRDQAWVRPGEIVRYVEATGDRLSSLSRREALKNIPPVRLGA